MGLIKAALGAAGGVMADQWKEFFYCEAIPSDVLVVKGQKKRLQAVQAISAATTTSSPTVL